MKRPIIIPLAKPPTTQTKERRTSELAKMFTHKFSLRVKIMYRTNYINIYILYSVRKTTGHAPLDIYKIRTVQFGK